MNYPPPDAAVRRIAGPTPDDFIDWRMSGPSVEVYDIAVGPAGRRRGTGRRLMRSLVELVAGWEPRAPRLVFAVTRANNEIAQQFYEALHFRVVGVLRQFYQDEHPRHGVDAVVYGYDVYSDRQRAF